MGEDKIKRQNVLKILIFLLLTLALSSVVPSYSAEPEQSVLSFSDLGYSKDIYLSGATTEFNIYLPNYRGLSKAKIELLLRFSGVLDNRSTFTILVDDTPLFTKNIGLTGYEPVVSFNTGHSRADHIKVTVRGHLFITGDICYDLPTGNLWMVISNNSKVYIAAKHADTNIANFFNNYDKDINIVLDKEADNLNILPLIYNLNRLNDWKEVNIQVNSEPVKGMRNIITGNFSNDIELKDGDLLVSTNGLSMLKKDLTGSFITPSANTSKLSTAAENKNNEISLMDMGIKGFTATGLGDLSFNVPIRFSAFSGIPGNLYMKLILNHTPVPESERAYLKVFLNGILIHAMKIEGGGSIKSYNIKIPEDQLRGYNNNLNIVTSYFISKGECRGSMPNLTISILDSSYFYFDGADRKWITPVVDVMGSMSGKVLIMVNDKDMFDPSVYLMDVLGKFNREITDIDVLPWKGEIPENYNFVILALSHSGINNINIPLKVNQGRFSIINPLSKKEMFSSDYSDSFGVLQTFDKGKAKVLLLSYYKDKSALEFMKGFDKDTLSRMLGNVVIFNQDMASFDIGEKFRVEYKEIKSTGYYWDKYKLFIILILGLLAIVFLYFIKKKIVRSEKEN
ncbi:MAG: cellulose biosynthesis cyclic di-GMP-binding regulatory protein BcsB [Nitrospirae bacterium]|nr:cellulose biosynthesis cyclic di-GMP-binding regulatory protein BcsB [Nitrospirota bacterium]